MLGSVLLHLAVLAVIGLQAPRIRGLPLDRSRPIAVALIRDKPPAKRATPRATPAARPPPATPSPAHAESPQAASAAPIAAAPAPPETPPQPTLDDNARAALRQALGCQIAPGQHQTQEEKARCSRGFAEAARTAPPVSGLDPALRQMWDAQKAAEAARRDGSAGQADLKSIRDARGAGGPARKNDINAGVSCGLAFGANAKPGLSGLSCIVAYPSSNTAKSRQ